MIPPWGVPFCGITVLPSGILIGAFRIRFSTHRRCLSRKPIAHNCFISLEWFT